MGLDGVGRVRQQQAASHTENLGKGPCSLFKVHPLDSAHATMARKVMEEVHVTGVVNPCWAVSPPTAREPVRPRVRESWTEAAPTVENRTWKWSHRGSRSSKGAAVAAVVPEVQNTVNKVAGAAMTFVQIDGLQSKKDFLS